MPLYFFCDIIIYLFIIDYITLFYSNVKEDKNYKKK